MGFAVALRARVCAQPQQQQQSHEQAEPRSSQQGLLRQRRFDQQLEAALQRAAGAAGSGKRPQVVLLGAGMDTRAWRHDWLTGEHISRAATRLASASLTLRCIVHFQNSLSCKAINYLMVALLRNQLPYDCLTL